MTQPRWVDRTALLILHGDSLARFGGAAGLRDEGLFDSALMRPVNLHLYEQCSDIVRLAAAYAFGLARNHPFIDGNKRAAFLASALFLRLNGMCLTAGQVAAYEAIIRIADGTWSEDAFAAWLQENLKKA